MPSVRFTPAPSRRHLAAIEAACAPGGPEDPLPAVSRHLAAIVPFDAAFWAASDPLTGLATSPALVDNIAPEHCTPYWEQEFLGDDLLLFADLSRRPRPVGTLADETGGRPGRSGRHRLVLAPSGLDAELRVAFVRGGCTWGVAALYRERGRSGFSAREQELVARMVPVIGDGLCRRALDHAASGPGVPAAPGMLMFDGSGRIQAMNDHAEEWLRLLPPDPYGSGDAGRAIATELLTVVQRARGARPHEAGERHPEIAATAARARAAGGAPARVRLRAVNGLWLVVHASRLAATRGGGDAVAVVIEAAKGSEMAPIIAEAFGLTAREREVTEAVARGEATGEIAARLHLSPHTVRDHLKAVFEKTGVRSRGELVARLFADHYQPRLEH